MKLEARPYRLEMTRPFRLGTGSRNHTDTILLTLTDEVGHFGYGEASLPPYLGQDVDAAMEFFRRVDAALLDPDHPGKSTDAVADALGAEHRAPLAAINIALHDLHCKREGVNFGAHIGTRRSGVATTYTIGHSTDEELKLKLEESADFGLIKLKLGSSDDRALIDAFRKHSTKPFCVDVNQAWKDFEQALPLIDHLHALGCIFVEQPFPVGMEEETGRLGEQSPLPLIADESVRDVDDFRREGGAFQGVNVKLMKAGGLDGAMRVMEEVRGVGKYLVVGCMAESSCAVTAASYLAPLADWADLDGPLLMRNDPFRGVEYIGGKVHLPFDKPGMGVAPIL